LVVVALKTQDLAGLVIAVNLQLAALKTGMKIIESSDDLWVVQHRLDLGIEGIGRWVSSCHAQMILHACAASDS
jgi:hypothetical protein